jgi:hypothetical protein
MPVVVRPGGCLCNLTHQRDFYLWKGGESMKALLILFLFFLIGGCASIPSKDLKMIHNAFVKCPDYWNLYHGDIREYKISKHRKCCFKK